MIITQEDIYLFMMVFLRVSALLLVIPFFAGQLIPKHLRLVIAGFMALMVYPAFASSVMLPSSLPALVSISIKELLIGLMMGFAVRMIFFTIEFSGHVISTEVGLMMSQSFDPVESRPSSTISTLLFYLTILVFFITGTHKTILVTFINSFYYIPINIGFFGILNAEKILRASNQVFIIGLQIAAPLIALNFIINMTFAVLGKAAPKINVFMISFAVRIFAGLSLLLMALHLILQYIFQGVENTPKLMLELITP